MKIYKKIAHIGGIIAFGLVGIWVLSRVWDYGYKKVQSYFYGKIPLYTSKCGFDLSYARFVSNARFELLEKDAWNKYETCLKKNYTAGAVMSYYEQQLGR